MRKQAVSPHRWKRASPILALLAAAALRADPTARASAAPTSPVPAWLADLGSDDWQTRGGAEDDLVRFGPECVPALKALAAATPDPETRARAESALKRISEWPLYPTFVTLRVKDAPAKEVFEELARQEGVALPVEQPGLWGRVSGRTVTLDLVHRPYWSAVTEACRQTGLTLRLDPADNRTVFLAQGTIGRPNDTGPALFLPPDLLPSNPLLFGPKVRRVRLAMLAEPRVRVIDYSLKLTLDEARDDAGRKVEADAPNYRDVSPSGHYMVVILQVAREAKSASRLRGKAGFEVAAECADFQFPDFPNLTESTQSARGVTCHVTHRPAAAEVQNAGAQRVDVQNVDVQNVDVQNVDVEVVRTNLSDEAWVLVSRYAQASCRLLDADGLPLFTASAPATEGDGRFTLHLSFTRGKGRLAPAPGPPKRLLIDIPVASRDIELPFDFTEVRL